jgi:thiol-disulfide isomerase/thioredoxin
MLCNTKFYSLLASVTIAAGIIFTPFIASAGSDAEIKLSSPKAIAELTYNDEEGIKKTVKTDNKRLTAVHFWATWCVPCVDELIQVDNTLKTYASKGFHVIALSEDGLSNMKKVKEFYTAHKITALKASIDGDMKSFQAGKARGLPTTIFLNSEGKEIARAEGAVDWAAKDTTDFIEYHLK